MSGRIGVSIDHYRITALKSDFISRKWLPYASLRYITKINFIGFIGIFCQMLFNHLLINNRRISNDHLGIEAMVCEFILLDEAVNACQKCNATFITCHFINHNKDMFDLASNLLHLIRQNFLGLGVESVEKDLFQVFKSILSTRCFLKRLNSDSGDDLARKIITQSNVKGITNAI